MSQQPLHPKKKGGRCPKAAASPLPPVTVLCLHGNRQNKDTFKRYCSNIEKKAKKSGVRFVFLEALYPLSERGMLAKACTAVEEEEVDNEKEWASRQRQWWPRFLDLGDVGRAEWTREMMIESAEALAAIHQAVMKSGATVLLGFSQGANAVITYMEDCRNPQIKRVVACSGYAFVRRGEMHLQPGIVKCALLNVVSKVDEKVPARLAPTHFESVQMQYHGNGHGMVTRAAEAQLVVDFCRGIYPTQTKL